MPKERLLKLIADVSLLLTVLFGLLGFGLSMARCFQNGWWGNMFGAVWLGGFGVVLAIQAKLVLERPQLVTKRPARYWTWMIYCTVMLAAAICCIVAYPMVPQTQGLGSIGWWAATWLPPLAILLVYVRSHHENHRAKVKAAHEQLISDPELPNAAMSTERLADAPPPFDPTASSRRGCACCRNGQRGCSCRACWSGFMSCCGWSSIGWLGALAFLLAFQAIYQAVDYYAYPPPGPLVPVTYNATKYQPSIMIFCNGSSSSGQSTLVLHAGGGSPSAMLMGLQYWMVQQGRRVCVFDRLGMGWSDDAIIPMPNLEAPWLLLQALRAVNETGPFIMAGHSVGGQQALLFAATYPSLVSGIAMLDSYSDSAIALSMGVFSYYNTTNAAGELLVVPNGASDGIISAIISLVRAITPLGFTRAIHTAEPGYMFGQAARALYCNNKEWQGQWAEFNAASPGELDAFLTERAAAQGIKGIFYGNAWPSFGSIPVIVMPASATLQLSCNVSLPACQQEVLDAPMSNQTMIYAQAAVLYAQTLSTNGTLYVVEGNHGFPSLQDKLTAGVLSNFFQGV